MLDACGLANAGVCDLFLRLAEPPRLYLPLWSGKILEEVHRTQTEKLKHPYPPELADYWNQEVTRAFPEASVYSKLGRTEHTEALAIWFFTSQTDLRHLRSFRCECE